MANPPNMGQMLKQVQQMQADIEAAQERLKEELVEGSAGGGSVKVTITGALEVRSVEIDPSAIDPDDPELLQDLIAAATNEAIRAGQTLAAERVAEASGGLGEIGAGLGSLGLPGL